MEYIVNVEAAIYKGDKWLIIKRSENEEHAPGILSHVGGKVEDNGAEMNVLESNLLREIFEEVGIYVHEEMEYLYSSVFNLDTREMVLNIIFLCKYLSGEVMVSEEAVEFYWMDETEILFSKKAPVWLKDSIALAENKRKHFGVK